MTTGSTLSQRLAATIRDVPDFPKPGLLFKDITPVLQDQRLFADSCAALAAPFRDAGITHVCAIESRGFLFGAPVALALDAALVPLRKPGKLPHETVRESYVLEYGSDALEVHRDALGPGARVLLVDDLLATGGTAGAAARLAERLGGEVVGVAVVVSLEFLPWRQALGDRLVVALVSF